MSMSAALMFAWRQRAVRVGLAAGICLAGAAIIGSAAQVSSSETLLRSEARPGETDPITNPKKLTLFKVNSVGLLASKNSAAYSDLFDFAAADADLKRWTLTAQALQQGDSCLDTPRRRVSHGRISSPEFEQAVCMTSFGLTVYTSPLTINDGRRVTLAFDRPGVSTIGRNFDVAVGALSRRPGEDEQPHQQIVAAHTNLDQRLEIDVIDWIGDKSDPTRGELKVAASYVGPDDERPSGDVAVSLGDFNNDNTLQIVTATDVSGGPGPGRIRLATYTYDAAKKALTRRGSSYPLDVPGGRPTSIVLASADFAGRGYEQIILGYIAPTGDGSKSQLTLSYFDPSDPSQVGPPKASRVMGAVAPNSYADIAPGLFRFDPQQAGVGTADPFFRRQLAVASAAPDGSVFAGVVAMEGDPPEFRVGQSAQLSVPGRSIATNGIGPSLAAGNFIGLKSTGVDPFDQIAVALPNPAGSAGTVTPEVVVAAVNRQNFDVSQVWRNDMPSYTARGMVFSIPILAYDRGGGSFYLGNPAHLTVPALIDPQYVVAMPPRHVDALPKADPHEDPPYDVVNLAGLSPSSFNVNLQDSSEQTLTQTSTDSSSSQFGGGTTQTVGSTVTAGVMDIASFETSTSVKTAVSYETNTVERNANKTYKSVTTQRSATTSEDDHLIFNMRTLDVWRYPVYGLNKQRDKLYPFYDIIIPGPLVQYSGGGLNYDWYSPPQQNYNAISYPAINSDGLFAQDIGEFSYVTDDKKKHVEKTPLNSATIRTFDGNEQSFSLNYTEEAGSSTEKTFQYTLSSSLDISVGFKASATIELFGGSASYDGSVSLSNRANWENAVLAERSMRNSRGITLNQPNVAGIIGEAYNYQTLIYITGNGGFKVAHGTDLLSSSSGAAWWRNTYGGKPDPAVNLPFRMAYDSAQGQWKLASGDQYFWLRGLTPTQPNPDPVTGAFQPLAGGVTEGDLVRMVVPIHNYSLNQTVENVVVSFGYQALNPQTYKPADPDHPDRFVEFARAKPVTIGPRGVASVDVIWNTKNLGGGSGAGIPYRFKVIVDPDNQIKNKLHGNDPKAGANTIGLWPWNTGFWVFHSGGRADSGVRPGGLRLGLNVKDGLAGPPGGSMADMASVSIDMPTSDPALRHLIISGVSRDGKRIALAARSLFGLGPGSQRLEVPLAAHNGLSPLQAWLSAGDLADDPLTGTWVTDDGSGRALALGR